eukprot:13754539-Heterocapsa_arctica.AAC.1
MAVLPALPLRFPLAMLRLGDSDWATFPRTKLAATRALSHRARPSCPFRASLTSPCWARRS